MDEHQKVETVTSIDARYAAVKRSEEQAMEAALAAEVTINLEKRAGSETFHRNVQASSASAAMNGLAVLVREYAKLLDMTVTEVLAVLATVLAAPMLRREQEDIL